MNCLLCGQEISLQPHIHELFLLKKPEKFICKSCEKSFEKIGAKHCPRCYKPGSAEICEDCKDWESRGVLLEHRALYRYNAAMQNYFIAYKFQGDYRLRKVFQAAFRTFPRGYTLVPIPVSPERYQERGFNQVSGFLEGLKYSELLIKKESVKQSSLSKKERLATENPFRLKAGVIIPQKILLIDDIYTSGQTLQHAIKALKKAGATDLKSFSLCR